MIKKVLLSFLLIVFINSISGFLDKAFPFDPKFKNKAHNVKVLKIRWGEDADSIWDLRSNPKLADIIILDLAARHLESTQIDILDNWVQEGGCLWLKEPLPIGQKWEFLHTFGLYEHSSERNIYGNRKYKFYAKPIYLENKNTEYILPHPLTMGVKKIELFRVEAIKQNFGDETQIIFQYKGIPYKGSDREYVVPIGTEAFEKFKETYKPQIFPIFVAKKYGKGRILFGKFNPSEKYDWERFWFNLKEWGAGYTISITKGNSRRPIYGNAEAYAGEIINMGNLTIVPFEPWKEESTAHLRTEDVAYKLVELTAQQATEETVRLLAGNIASKALGFATAVISQMPSVGNITTIDCYFIIGEEITKKAEMYSKEQFPIPYYSVGILVYVFLGDTVPYPDINIELYQKLRILSKTIFKEKIPSSFFEEYGRHGFLITSSKPIILRRSGEYVLEATGSEAFLRIR